MKKWITPFEKSGGQETASYDEALDYFARLAKSSRHAKMSPFGVSPQGRTLYNLVVARGRGKTPAQAHRSGKAVVMIQNAIHGGEMEGKDAWMLLLREILITRELEHLLDHLVLVLVPVFNVDGHERMSRTNRPNQNGPIRMGWRTTSHNLDLNRDYMKADAPEMKALLELYHHWLPDFYIDNHSTDGADYQYHVLYCLETHQNLHSILSGWLESEFIPAVTEDLEEEGFLTAPYNEANDINTGVVNSPAPARLSTGYSAVQNRICLLVEAHSLKPFENRVLSTRAMNVAALEFINEHCEELKDRNRFADEDTVREYFEEKEPFPITVTLKSEPQMMPFKGIQFYEEESSITGNSVTRYTGEPVDLEIPLYNSSEITGTIIVPEAYAIPHEFSFIVEHLTMHGVHVEMLEYCQSWYTERYRFKNVTFASWPYESRLRPNFELESFEMKMELQPGTWIVPCAQRTLRAIVHLLEPDGADSMVRWGFLNAIFERKEYAEAYIMEPIAQKMLKEDSALRNEFNRRLKNEGFRNNPKERLDFFYQRSVYFDRTEKVYPIARLMGGPL